MSLSYRTRLFAAAALVVGGALAATLALSWSDLRAVEEERLDARLCLEARRFAWQRFDPQQLPRLEADVATKLRLGEEAKLLLRVEPAAAAPFQSERWPADAGADRLQWAPGPAATNGARPSTPASGPPPREAGSDPRARPAPRDPPPRVECALAAFALDGSPWRAARVDGPAGRGYVAASVEAATDELRGVLRGTLRVVVPMALVMAGLAAWLLSAVSMRPISRLREAMKAVDGRDLGRRLSPRGEDREFQELIAAYNTMLERLQASFEQASRFSADAAHELRTPLTILQGRLEQAIRRSERRAIQGDLTDMLEELGRLAAITRKLLLLSQADAGQIVLARADVDLSEMLDALVADARMLAPGSTVTASVEDGLVARLDRLLVGQLLNNLVSNAVRYCTPGGAIEIVGRRLPAAVEVTIANACEPIPAQEREHLFDRFYRRDSARNRRTEGTGLGLSLAREIARAHGGDLVLDPGAPDAIRLRLRMPLS